jgi:hypothetical protein
MRLRVVALGLLLVVGALHACSSDATTGSTPLDAGDEGTTPLPPPPAPPPQDAASEDASSSACPQGKSTADAGETCTGFGKGDPCTPECGLYGYVCFNGGPPGFTGCLRVSSTSFGDTYCCAENKCVAEPDQDSHCAGAAGKPHLYQCPPDGTDGGSVAPPAGCATTTPLGPYAYYCCL